MTVSDVYVIDGRFACSTCVPSEVRDAMTAEMADRHTVVGCDKPVTACCNERVHYSSEDGVHVK